MAETNIGTLATVITAKTEPFERGMKKAGRATSDFRKEAVVTAEVVENKFQRKLRKATNFLMSPVGFVAAMGSLVAAGKYVASEFNKEAGVIDAIGKLSTRLDVSAEALQAWKFGAAEAGLEFTALQQGLQAFQKRTGEAARGTGEAATAFKQLGISAESLMRLPLDQRLGIVADRLNELGTEADKAQAAAKIFSDVGKGPMLNFLAAGSAGLEDMSKKAKELGIVLNDETVDAIEATNDALYEFQLKATGIKRQMVGEVFPALLAILKDIEKAQDMLAGDKETTGPGGKSRVRREMEGASLFLGPLGYLASTYYLARGDVEKEMAKGAELEKKLEQSYARQRLDVMPGPFGAPMMWPNQQPTRGDSRVELGGFSPEAARRRFEGLGDTKAVKLIDKQNEILMQLLNVNVQMAQPEPEVEL